MNIRNYVKSSIVSLLAASLLTLSLAFLTFAQTGTSSVRGTVKDPQGNVVPGAKVTLKQPSKGFSRTQTTNEEGRYSFVAVQPDTYTVEIEATSFKKVVATVIAPVDEIVDQNINLEIGAVTESITITSGDEAPLNTTNAAIGNSLGTQQVQDLPLSARNTADLLSLQPGVTTSGEVNGGRSDQANVTLDGVDVNEQQGGAAFFSVLRVSQEALQEFRVTTSNADADKGRSSGAQVSLVSRRGSNDWRGSGYFYFRPDKKFQANDYFNNSDGVEQLRFGRRNYGGSVSGPIRADKLFFFANYERFEEDRDIPVNRLVPLAPLGQGIVRYFTEDGSSDAGCPAGTPSGVDCLTPAEINAGYISLYGSSPGINPLALAALASGAAKYKSNNDSIGDGLNTGGYRFNAPTKERNNTFISTLDYVISQNQLLQGRIQTQIDKGTSVQRFKDSPVAETWSHPMGFAVSHNWTIGSNLVNKATYGLTRAAFTTGSDAGNSNQIFFRFIYQPLNFSRSVARITPVHNIVDDLTWIKGKHTITTGGNLRFISNQRTSFGSSYDSAIMNPSFYDFSGDVVLDPFTNYSDGTSLRDALTAAIGRYTQYTFNTQYGANGAALAGGSPSVRNFKTEEFEAYVQDSFKVTPSLTLNYGVRFSTTTPVYEANGLQVKPVQSLGEFFDLRVQGMNNGTPYNQLISVDKAGKANGKTGYYKQDWNNFAPSVSAAWSPNFKDGFLRKLFGGDGKSVIRGGFRMTYDRTGSALAVAFDLNSTLGYSSSNGIAANTFSTDPAGGSAGWGPLFTGFNQIIRANPSFSTISYAPSISFPLQTPADEDQRIEQSLDDRLTTPYHYNMNLQYGREVGKGVSIEVGYVGRIARNLLVSRDTVHFNNLRDPASGQTFYSVMKQLLGYRNANAAITSIPSIAWVERFLPGLAGTYANPCGGTLTLTASQAAYRRVARSRANNSSTGACIGGRNTTDYTFVQTLWDDVNAPNLFIHPQYATFAAYTSLGTSDYHGMQMSVRKRFAQGLSFDVNYTFSHSLDTASGTEESGSIRSGASLILNPLDLNENRADSDFDIRHLLNANFVYDLPFGSGKTFFGDADSVLNGIVGGWKMSGIFRYNSGAPIGQPFDAAVWATNWNVQSNGVRLTDVQVSPTKNGEGGRPNLFADPIAAYRSYRNAMPGEAGDRNILRAPSYVALDLGLAKTIKLAERHKLTFRFDVFNVTNTQRFTGISDFSLESDPSLASFGAVPQDWGRFTDIQGAPRVVQFAFRYDF